ncbi:hypothetical protein N7U66_00290 [Lacinutrix neustonica]|uniref:Uncharacterized protein n=1 Tax=Lacinutrix neustonica TaxID=2980107 RepID=A0A9E8MWJ9_9FLAO|nr:hypothetical protein [Lacinutrix neustonica]WAC02260.1 hypothetical protein N7U66_00290 [Lacinutrix neustonica]
MIENSMEDIKKDLDKMKETILNDYQYYDRRFDTVSMVFSGFGLYGCFEMLKWYLTSDYKQSFWLAIPIILWLIILFWGLHNISREKRIREYYMQQIMNIPKLESSDLNDIKKDNIELEDKLRNSRKWIFSFSILGVVLMLVSLVCFLMIKS